MTETQQNAYRTATDHIRNHLLKPKNDKTIKTNGIESYKFRPNPNKKLSPFTSAEGPELYYLDLLNPTEPNVGSQLFSHPFSIDTPEQLVWRDSPEDWKTNYKKKKVWERKKNRLNRRLD